MITHKPCDQYDHCVVLSGEAQRSVEVLEFDEISFQTATVTSGKVASVDISRETVESPISVTIYMEGCGTYTVLESEVVKAIVEGYNALSSK